MLVMIITFYSEDMFISAIGVSNLVIVQTTDALLVANKDTVQDVKKNCRLFKTE